MNYGMPNMMPGQMMPGQMMPNMMNPGGDNLMMDLESRLSKIERQIKRLDQRLTRLETPYKSNNNLDTDSGMYMM